MKRIIKEKRHEREKERDGEFSVIEAVQQKTTEELFEEFYFLIREKEMDDARKTIVREVIKDLT